VVEYPFQDNKGWAVEAVVDGFEVRRPTVKTKQLGLIHLSVRVGVINKQAGMGAMRMQLRRATRR
jgi:hypothetical protein